MKLTHTHVKVLLNVGSREEVALHRKLLHDAYLIQRKCYLLADIFTSGYLLLIF